MEQWTGILKIVGFTNFLFGRLQLHKGFNVYFINIYIYSFDTLFLHPSVNILNMEGYQWL